MNQQKNAGGRRLDDRLDKLSQVLADGGHRLTASRRIILEILVDRGGHLTADELAREVRERDDSVSRMTIYRTLDLLCDLGQARPIYQGARAARYILMEDGSHHHFVCSSCARVYEFDGCLIDDLSDQVQGVGEFDVHAHLLELYGICDGCQS